HALSSPPGDEDGIEDIDSFCNHRFQIPNPTKLLPLPVPLYVYLDLDLYHS
ncbi:hypothetical protein L208DRAFT_1419317, partial [Tricholoma matsutake]